MPVVSFSDSYMLTIDDRRPIALFDPSPRHPQLANSLMALGAVVTNILATC